MQKLVIILTVIAIPIIAFVLQRNNMFIFDNATVDKFVSTLIDYASSTVKPEEKVFQKEELALHDGNRGHEGLYLGILGKVYDVTKGERHYGPGGGYEFFSGRDGSRGFITGDFSEEGLTDNLDGLTNMQILELMDWVKLYDTQYTFLGVLEGTYYNSEGKPTAAHRNVMKRLDAGRGEERLEKDDNQRFPPCNSHWSENEGTTVWCTPKSGGAMRKWAGVPRLYHRPGKTFPRCACVKTTGPPTDDPKAKTNHGDLKNPRFEVYKGCHEDSETCSVKK